MTLKYIWRSFQPRLSFPGLFLQSLACFRVARSPSKSWASCFVCPSRYDARHRKPRRCICALKLGGTGIRPRTILVIVPIFVFVLVLVLVLQQAATYSIAAVAGNWTILVIIIIIHCQSFGSWSIARFSLSDRARHCVPDWQSTDDGRPCHRHLSVSVLSEMFPLE